MKIYDEVVIDMNPESSTFEKTLYEDSYEYNGPLMEMGKEWTDFIFWGYGHDGEPYYVKYRVGASNDKTYEGAIFKGENKVKLHSENFKRGGSRNDYKGVFNQEVLKTNDGKMHTQEWNPQTDPETGEYRDYGAPNITKEMFYEDDGRRKDIEVVKKVITDHFGPQDETKMNLAIQQQFPSMEDLDTKEVEFLQTRYGGANPGPDGVVGTDDDGDDVTFGDSLAGEEAGQALEKDMYGLQTGAAKLGKQSQAVYSGMMSSKRAQKTGTEALAKGFESAQDKYGLSEKKADLSFKESMYDLEKKRFDEQEFSSWLTENFADAKGDS